MKCTKCTLPLDEKTGWVLKNAKALCPVCAGVQPVTVKRKGALPVANPCPQCTRPMGIGATRCMYCGSVKEPSPISVTIKRAQA